MSEKTKKLSFSEEYLDKIQEDINACFTELIKEKMEILKLENGWSNEKARKQDIHWDTSVEHYKNSSRWSLKQASNKVEKIACFLGMETRDVALFYNEDITDESTNYDMFYSYIKEPCMPMEKRVRKFVNALDEEGFIQDICCEYGEPGYTKKNDSDEIITADWNDLSAGIIEIIEENGYEIEWSDEWVSDYENNKIYRSSPNSCRWEPSYFIYESEVLGIEGNEELYIEWCIYTSGKPKLLSSTIDLEKFGFIDLEKVCRETGWYGTVEDPQVILDKFSNMYDELVVQTCSVNQFSVNWKVYGRNTIEQ